MGVRRGRSAQKETKTRTITLSKFRLWVCFVQKNKGVVKKEATRTRRSGERARARERGGSRLPFNVSGGSLVAGRPKTEYRIIKEKGDAAAIRVNERRVEKVARK